MQEILKVCYGPKVNRPGFSGGCFVWVNPRLLSDNGPCYISGELSEYLQENGTTQTRGRPYHPQTRGKIERWYGSMKNQILLNNYYLASELQEHLQHFMNYYNHERYYESLDKLTPADVFYGWGQAILDQRERIKLNTLRWEEKCTTIIRLFTQPDELECLLNQDVICPKGFDHYTPMTMDAAIDALAKFCNLSDRSASVKNSWCQFSFLVVYKHLTWPDLLPSQQ